MPKFDIETLVDLVVNRARVDTTAPDPSNLRNGWFTDALLTQAIDSLVVGQYNDPATYAEIGRKVLVQVGNLPEMAALAQLAIFRGERLLPLTQERKESTLQVIQDLEKTIALLPNGPRKMRCQSLCEYHQGIFYDACGLFDLASELQLRSARGATSFGDIAGHAIGIFMASVFSLKHALCECCEKPVLHQRFGAVQGHFDHLVTTLCGTALEAQWAQVNGPVYMIEACIWLDIQSHSGWNKWVATALTAMEKLGSSWDLCADFVRAVDMAHRQSLESEAALKAVAGSSDANERRAAALLILMHRAILQRRREYAHELIDQMPEQGAQHVIAVAKSSLEL